MSIDARAIADELLDHRPTLPPLEPGSRVYSQSIKQRISLLADPPLVIASLHLANDDIDACHAIVHEHNTPNGMWLHATLHRREGDYWNSLYWLNRLEHPIVKRQQAAKFVQECQRASSPRGRDGVGATKAELKQQQMEQLREIVRWVLDHEGSPES